MGIDYKEMGIHVYQVGDIVNVGRPARIVEVMPTLARFEYLTLWERFKMWTES